MSEEIRSCFKLQTSFARYILILSVLLILGTIIPSIFALPIYNSMCICTINYLAYAWIVFAITALLSLISMARVVMASAAEKCCKSNVFPNILLWLQVISFTLGLVFLLIFIARFTQVI